MTERARATVLILPGIGNSGPQHWQSEWERRDASMIRVVQDEWDAPDRRDWEQRLDDTVRSIASDVILVTHSSSCALVAHWCEHVTSETLSYVRGALLVGPSDPDGPNYPVGPTHFSPVPRNRLPFPSIVVASDNDIYVDEPQAKSYADAWGAEYVLLRGAGHINSESGLGHWPEGLALLEKLQR